MRYLFLFLFLFSSNSYAYYSESHTYVTDKDKARSACLSSAGSHSCNWYAYGSSKINVSTSNSSTQTITRWIYDNSTGGACPSGKVADSSTGFCVDPPSCPSAGTSVNINESKGLDGSIASYEDSYSIDGCAVNKIQNEGALECWENPNTSIAQCGPLIRFEHTGTASSIREIGDDAKFTVKTDDDEFLESGDHTTGESTTSLGQPTVISMPDGSTVESKTDTLIEVKDKGVTITATGTTKRIEQSDGLIKTENITTVTTTNSDGTKTVKTVKDTSYEQTPKTVQTHNSTTNNYTNNTTSSITGSNTTTTITNYNSSGSETGSSTSSSNSGNGSGEASGDSDQDSQSFCEERPNSVECKSYESAGSLYESSGKTFDNVLSDFTSGVANSEVMTAGSGFFQITAAAPCPVWSANLWFVNIVIDQQCSSSFASALYLVSKILLACATFLAFRFAFL